MAYKWEFLDPEICNPSKFGFEKLWAVKVKRHDYKCDVRGVKVLGDWNLYVDYLNFAPVSGKQLRNYHYFIFAAKGE